MAHTGQLASHGSGVLACGQQGLYQRLSRARSATVCAGTRSRSRNRDMRLPDIYHLQPPSSCSARPAPAPPTPPTDEPPALPSSLALDSFSARVSLERLYHLGPSADSLASSVSHMAAAPPPTEEKAQQRNRNSGRSPDYFANVGDCIRTLREDIPELFNRELNYSIYRDDIVFRDPRIKFEGIKNYRTVFWSLRFHGRIFFSKLYVEVKRIWQPTDDVIKMRWTVHGIPRVPWEAEGLFDGVSTYKLDSQGRIYEHSVDNVLLRDPPMLTNPPLLAGLNLVPSGAPQQPVPGAWCTATGMGDSLTVPQLDSSMQGQHMVPAPVTVCVQQPSVWPLNSLHASTAALHRDLPTPLQQLLQPSLWHEHAPQGPAQAMLTTTSTVTGAPQLAAANTQPGTVPAAGCSVAGVQVQQGGAPALLLKQFSWVRLYAALCSSVALLGWGSAPVPRQLPANAS